MKYKVVATLLFVFLAVAAVPASAQSATKAKVPFDFKAGKALLPAGEYLVSIAGNRTLLLSQVNGTASAFVGIVSLPEDGLPSKLVFRHLDDNSYVLTGVGADSPYTPQEIVSVELDKRSMQHSSGMMLGK